MYFIRSPRSVSPTFHAAGLAAVPICNSPDGLQLLDAPSLDALNSAIALALNRPLPPHLETFFAIPHRGMDLINSPLHSL